MFAQESVMDIQRQAFQEWYIANHHDGDIHPNQQLLEWSEKGGFYFASSVEDLWEAWQAAKAQAVPEVKDIGNELQSWVAVWSFKARHDREDYIVVDANLLAEKIEKLTGANA